MEWRGASRPGGAIIPCHAGGAGSSNGRRRQARRRARVRGRDRQAAKWWLGRRRRLRRGRRRHADPVADLRADHHRKRPSLRRLGLGHRLARGDLPAPLRGACDPGRCPARPLVSSFAGRGRRGGGGRRAAAAGRRELRVGACRPGAGGSCPAGRDERRQQARGRVPAGKGAPHGNRGRFRRGLRRHADSAAARPRARRRASDAAPLDRGRRRGARRALDGDRDAETGRAGRGAGRDRRGSSARALEGA